MRINKIFNTIIIFVTGPMTNVEFFLADKEGEEYEKGILENISVCR